jgi:hypothetical protein
MPSERNTSAKASVNLVSRSWIRNLGDRPFSWRVKARFRACWVTQAESGWEVTPPRWTVLVSSSIHTSTYRVFNRIVSTVRKSHARIAAACWRRNSRHEGATRGSGSQAGTAEHRRDRGGRDAHPELEQLAANPHVAPPGVLPSQAQDQLPNLGVESGTSRGGAAWSTSFSPTAGATEGGSPVGPGTRPTPLAEAACWRRRGTPYRMRGRPGASPAGGGQ